jgi:hypothetical protein
MALTHTWRAVSKPGQRCQEPTCQQEAVWVLMVRGARSEELLCAACAVDVARLFGLSDPTNSPAEAAASAQTEDPVGAENTDGVNPCTEASEQ